MFNLSKKQHNIVNKPTIYWTESVLEGIALTPLHIILGLVNKLYSDTNPSDCSPRRGGWKF